VTQNLDRIQAKLQKKKFVFPPAKGIKAKKKGKAGFRPLVIAPVESRVVQRAVHDVLLTVPGIDALMRTPYSFGGVKKHEDDELSAVPAAIKAVLESIGSGGAYVVRSDISKFFTKIPKSEVRNIVSSVIADADFMDLFDRAVASELSNMAELRDDANAFPIEDVGVAQGNSLSPLLGNLLLKDFDKELNALPNIRCIRYIDDFIILGLNKQTTWKAFLKAQALLSQWNMELAVDKTFQGSSQQCFEFLGIEFNNGFLRPSSASRARFMDSARALLSDAAAALIQYRSSGLIERRVAFLKTLITLSETTTGWGMHYRFCNDSLCLRKLDEEISHLLKDYFGKYRDVREAAGPASTWDLLGIQSLEKIERQTFTWPKRSKTA
jgi:RNA-directed DNA polymerase